MSDPTVANLTLLRIEEPGPRRALLAITDVAGRELLAIDVRDGQIVTTYDPADLDEAARQFADALAREWNTFAVDYGPTLTRERSDPAATG